MPRIFQILASAILLSLSSMPAKAASIVYKITGTGSGLVGNTAFTNAAYSITLNGDTNNVFNFGAFTANDPLISSVIRVSGFGAATLGLPTRIGVTNSGAVAFFSRSSSIGGADLLDFRLATTPNLRAAFAPLLGTGVFALNQFVNVPSDLGAISLNQSSDVFFSASTSAVPEPATWAMMICGFGLAGAAMRRRHARKPALVA